MYKNNIYPKREDLLATFLYEPETGDIRWKIKASRNTAVNSIAGTIDANGFRVLTLNGKRFLASRAIWLMEYGFLPEFDVVYKDKNRSNLRLSNLIIERHSHAVLRQDIPKHNISGFKGVHWDKQKKKYRAMICINQKDIHLGFFSKPVDASNAYKKAYKKYFPKVDLERGAF